MTTKKRTSLDAIFGSEETASVPLAEVRAGQGEPSVPQLSASSPKRASKQRPKRPSVKQHTAYLPIRVHEQLRKLAFEENRKIHTYLLEGLDRVFAERGLPPINNLQ